MTAAGRIGRRHPSRQEVRQRVGRQRGACGTSESFPLLAKNRPCPWWRRTPESAGSSSQRINNSAAATAAGTQPRRRSGAAVVMLIAASGGGRTLHGRPPGRRLRRPGRRNVYTQQQIASAPLPAPLFHSHCTHTCPTVTWPLAHPRQYGRRSTFHRSVYRSVWNSICDRE